MTCERRIWKFGDDVNTDLIIPGMYLDNYDPSHLASHAMEGANADFARSVKEGDIILAGRNFGCGSSREQAVTSLRACGIQTVVAASFARIFYRNAAALGIAVYESPEAYDAFEEGEKVLLEREECVLRSIDGSKEIRLRDMPPHLKTVIDSGGLLPYLKCKIVEHPKD
ncbi:MAG: 3-isopropylmalate dehydratase small subunit [Methanobacteriota archaeon]|nr:MAG: 3-isopropylmalate dehydratase small subunit [Euryarchaeota archaeon]